jgi:hypothetical protein
MDRNQQYAGGDNGGGGVMTSPAGGSKKKKKPRFLKKLGRVVGIGRRKSDASEGSYDDSSSQYSDTSSSQQQQQQQQLPPQSTQQQLHQHFQRHQQHGPGVSPADNVSIDMSMDIIEEESDDEFDSDEEDDDDDDDDEQKQQEDEKNPGDESQKRPTFYSAVKSNLMISKKAKELPHDRISDEDLAKTGNSLASTVTAAPTKDGKSSIVHGGKTPPSTPQKKPASATKKKKKAASPSKKKDSAGAQGGGGTSVLLSKKVGPVSLVVLLVDPVSLRFELLQLAFQLPTKVSVEDALKQASQNVTEPILKGLRFTGLLDGSGQLYDEKATIATAVSKSIGVTSSSTTPVCHKVLLVASLPSTTSESLTKLTRPILSDQKVVTMLKGQGYDLEKLGWVPTTHQKQREAVLGKNTSVGVRYRTRRTILGMPISLAVTIGFIIILNLIAFTIIYGSKWYAAQQQQQNSPIVDDSLPRPKEILLKEEVNILSFVGVAGMTSLAEVFGTWTASIDEHIVDPMISVASSLHATILAISGYNDDNRKKSKTAETTKSTTPTTSTSSPTPFVSSIGEEQDEDVLDLDM